MKYLFLLLLVFGIVQTQAQIKVEPIGVDSTGSEILRWTTKDTLSDGRIVQISNTGKKSDLVNEYRTKVRAIKEQEDALMEEIVRLRQQRKAIIREFKLTQNNGNNGNNRND